ncbi:hypothetical protein [Cysteiniphilum sp. JM-1]|uniref:hypothetical protein n=1 Tax=Cysteiniphilum sp. JM-1 TaxID=2610891 RepID=UPI0012467192|nr:hypothetical protein [Cysteiniphilum sp. JM-1]
MSNVMSKLIIVEPVDILNYLPTMNSWCKEHLRHYPYYYFPESSQQVSPADTMYINERRAKLVVVQNNEQVISISPGIPLDSFYLARDYFAFETIQQFQSKGYVINSIWYIGYFLVDYASQEDMDLLECVYQAHLLMAKQNKCEYIAYVEPENTVKHNDDKTLAEPWSVLSGEIIDSGVTCDASWSTIQKNGDVLEEKHSIRFYLRKVR